MTFAADPRHWPTLAAFQQHLAAHDPAVAAWAQGLTLHHTYRPLPSQWRGVASLAGLRDFYVEKGWSAGPHLFLVAGAPDPKDDGIWQLTPLSEPGIHAGQCNTALWGIEIAGGYDRVPWPTPVADLVYGVGCALLVADEHVPQTVLLEDLVVDGQDGPARIAENDLNALIDQGFDDHLCSGQ